MPQQAQNNMKGTSPSKLVQGVVNADWGAQQKTNTTAQGALADKHTNNPVTVPGSGK